MTGGAHTDFSGLAFPSFFFFFKASFSAVIYQSTAYGMSSKDSRQPVSLMPSASVSLILLLLLQIKL